MIGIGGRNREIARAVAPERVQAMMAAASSSMAARQAAAVVAAVMRSEEKASPATFCGSSWAPHAQVVELAFGPAGDAGHRGDDADGIDSDGRLGREHHRRGSVQHGVGHVGHLGTRRREGGDHRLEHLGGGDDGPAVANARIG